jgi:hemoglobin
MTRAWNAIGGLLLVTAVATVGMPRTLDAQWCHGAYQPGAGTNFSGACPPPPKLPLYERLGGRHAIAVVVGDFVGTMAADPRVNARFKALKPPEIEKFKSNLADQICEATGGPCSYLGKDMKSAHQGMQISEVEWNATVENLGKALDKNKVGAEEQKELLGALGPMKRDIVGQ